MNKKKHIKKNKGLSSKLNQVFLIQIVFISVATILGVFGAAKVVENILIKEALIGESEFFWQHLEKDDSFSQPNTMNLTGYLVKDKDYSNVPESLLRLKENYQRVEIGNKYPIAYKSVKDDMELYLIFEESQVSKLALYFGIAPLVFVLLAIYLPAFVSYVLSKRAISPILLLIKKIESLPITKQQLEDISFDDINTSGNTEVLSLVNAFENFSVKISEYITRERNFSRYASHELRTPLTVLKGSVALLSKKDLDAPAKRLVNRIEPVILEMQELIESLLLLSREDEVVYSDQPLVVNDLVKHIAQQTISIFHEKNIMLDWSPTHLVQAKLPEQLFAIVITNLVRNACLYSNADTQVCIDIIGDEILIKDHGRGMTEDQMKKIFEPFYRVDDEVRTGGIERKGFGLGLSIVEWICNQCDWKLSYTSEIGKGTTVRLQINDVEKLN